MKNVFKYFIDIKECCLGRPTMQSSTLKIADQDRQENHCRSFPSKLETKQP